ncbi:MAG: hypothetical protein KY455_13475 [Euryarchaeota archaeon]|nr:hypothetical protein [Euryarchaeota archaeon]
MSSLRVLKTIGLPLVALLLVASVASAQATLDLAIENLDAGMDVEVGDDAHTMTFAVKLTGKGFVCPAPSSFPITLTLDGDSPDIGFNGSVTPTSMSIAVPQGAYIEPPLTPYTGSADATLEVEVGNNVPKNHGPHTFTITATGTQPTDCQASSWTINPASQTHAVNPIYPNVTETPTDGGGPAPEGGDDGGGDSEEGTGVGPMFVIGLAAVALARLRRR